MKRTEYFQYGVKISRINQVPKTILTKILHTLGIPEAIAIQCVTLPAVGTRPRGRTVC